MVILYIQPLNQNSLIAAKKKKSLIQCKIFVFVTHFVIRGEFVNIKTELGVRKKKIEKSNKKLTNRIITDQIDI